RRSHSRNLIVRQYLVAAARGRTDDYRFDSSGEQMGNLVGDRVTRRTPVHVEGVRQDQPVAPHQAGIFRQRISALGTACVNAGTVMSFTSIGQEYKQPEMVSKSVSDSSG